LKTIYLKSNNREEFINITVQVADFVRECCVKENGVLFLYVPHTTAAITINESADPDVAKDIKVFLNKLVPKNHSYSHLEGNSDAHIKSSLFGCSKEVFVEKGNLVLGTWQGIFFCEFDGPRNRQVYIKFINSDEETL
jgi:secondary thiamine-phosphate synthase enzyme